MAYWGEAWVLGPNVNAPMMPEAVAPAWTALQKALEKFGSASPRERDYILALASRYTAEPIDDRAPLDKAFADAMRTVAAKYPDDLDAQVIFAEAVMDTSPWHYWDDDGTPLEFTPEILATLERVLARAPDHPQACHLYIHAVEKTHPEWAEACADRLDGLCPGAGHLVHMPSHIYIRLGRYSDAVDVNEMAAEADTSYAAQCHAQGLYPVAYMQHNHHFIWFGACMQGRSVRAAEAACHMADHADQQLMRQPGFEVVQHFWLIPLYSMLRFGEWEQILHESEAGRRSAVSARDLALRARTGSAATRRSGESEGASGGGEPAGGRRGAVESHHLAEQHRAASGADRRTGPGRRDRRR